MDYDEDFDYGGGSYRPFYIEGARPTDRLPGVGQQLVDAWRAEHGDEPFPE